MRAVLADDAETAAQARARRREAFHQAVLAADRMTMQVVQTALSLIGFGFSITAFFFEAPTKGLRLDVDAPARRLGLALLSLGLLFLGMSLGTQLMHRGVLLSRYLARKPTSADRFAVYVSPAMITAALLLVIGLVAWSWVVMRRLAG
jgi:putative membrane protein